MTLYFFYLAKNNKQKYKTGYLLLKKQIKLKTTISVGTQKVAITNKASATIKAT